MFAIAPAGTHRRPVDFRRRPSLVHDEAERRLLERRLAEL